MNSKKNATSEKKLTSTIVDLSYLYECFDGEKEILIQVIAIFLKQAKEKTNELENGILTKNYGEITNAAHFLKSSFSTMGVACYEDIKEIEALSKQNHPIEGISSALKKMKPKYTASIDEYESLLYILKSQ